MRTLSLLCTAVSLTLASAALAYPAITGASGTAALPTTKTVPAGELIIGADFQGATSAAVPLRVTYGVLPGLEVGGAYLPQQGNQSWALHAKYNLGEQPIRRKEQVQGASYGQYDLSPTRTIGVAATAVGIQYLHQTDRGDQVLQPYLAASSVLMTKSTLVPMVQTTAGVNLTHSSLAGATAMRTFGSVGLFFRNGLVVAGEYQQASKKLPGETKPIRSLVVRYPVSRGIAAQVGVTNAQGVVGTDHCGAFAGLTYTLDTKRTREEKQYIDIPRVKSYTGDMFGEPFSYPIEITPWGRVEKPKGVQWPPAPAGANQ